MGITARAFGAVVGSREGEARCSAEGTPLGVSADTRYKRELVGGKQFNMLP